MRAENFSKQLSERSDSVSKPVVAIVGRPNVGKSTLFNKLVGSRLSIVDDTPGVTRDRIYGDCEWLNKSFLLIDTGGIEPFSNDVILSQMRRQAQLAIDSADVIILVTDVRTGVVANDEEVASMLIKSGKPVVLCVNKCDTIGEAPLEFYEFYNLGLGEPVQVSSVHGHGTGDLLDVVIKHFPQETDEQEEDEYIKVAIIGKPNVGKSSLVNAIAGEERVIVSDIAGTTRDATDTIVENKYGKFVFIDTAGLRRKSRVYDEIEKYSVIRARMAVERAQVCIIMIDAVEGFTEQDSKVAGIAHELGKGCIIAVNKWDAVEKDGKTMDSYRKGLMDDFAFMSYAPIIFISAKTGQRLDRLFELIKFVDSQNAMRISTGKLNDILAEATARVQPPTDKGRRLKIYYMTQASTRPPTFVFFVNRKDLFHYSYQRYIDNRIREVFGLEGTPTHIVIREREQKK
jgi:GTP-binding protein